MSSAYNDAASASGSTGQPKRRRKKRSHHNRDLSTHNIGGASRSNPGSGRDYNTNTDLSSGGMLYSVLSYLLYLFYDSIIYNIYNILYSIHTLEE